MSNHITVGTRVRVADADRVGSAFRGKAGVVSKDLGGGIYFVDFDFTNSTDHRPNGGTWRASTLTVIDTVEDVLARLRQAERDLASERTATSTLKADRDEAREVRDAYRTQRDAALVKLERAEADLVQSNASWRLTRDQRDTHAALHREAEESCERLIAERDRANSNMIRLDATLDYARSFLSESENSEVDGFNVGWNAARS